MKAAILGGGIAGISSAIALKQQGFDVSVYERHHSISSTGAGLVIWPNAAFVLEQLGVLKDIEKVAGSPTKMQRFSSTGENLGAIDITLINRLMGYSSLSILRRDLQRILISKLASLGVSIEYGHSVATINTIEPGKAEVCFQNGRRITNDIIISADGRMASVARQYILGDNKPVYQQFINWVGIFESEQDVFQDIQVKDYWGVGARFGIVPISNRKAYWAGAIACPDVGLRKPVQYKPELHSIFSSWPNEVLRMIQGTSVKQINKIYVHDHNPCRIWHKNNLLMIGDAAHAPLPTSGQGACQALEDAWHLANCLAESPEKPVQAFENFTRLRIDKTTNITMAARGFASLLFNQDENFCKARNQNSKKSDLTASAISMSKLWGLHLPLKDALPE